MDWCSLVREVLSVCGVVVVVTLCSYEIVKALRSQQRFQQTVYIQDFKVVCRTGMVFRPRASKIWVVRLTFNGYRHDYARFARITCRRVWGYAPPEKFWILDALRLILEHSGTLLTRYIEVCTIYGNKIDFTGIYQTHEAYVPSPLQSHLQCLSRHSATRSTG